MLAALPASIQRALAIPAHNKSGTIDDIQRRIQERIDAGVEEIFLHTMTADLEQLDLFAEHILKPFSAVKAKAAS